MSDFLLLYRSLRVLSLISSSKLNLRRGEYIILILIIGLYDANNGVLTQYDVVKANKDVNESTTRTNIYNLQKKGYITSNRSNQFFSRSYLTLTDKSLLLQSRIKSLLEG